ncbi:D-xylose-proton symporter-like 2 [Heracleum sosnowskyi]|uniref:D-xylose-proton symporter-like 2 n=1 Tax=Heracleum sosnowskyi TaxID=360622 RepID=A0AAD8N271_9APIA|nr:D-xylose-proton symporter-like 2 [Heracleum sosnowskyi]
MAGVTSSSSNTTPSLAPKILLAKPALVSSSAAKFNRSGADDDSASSLSLRSRNLAVGSLNLISDSSWDFHSDRFLPFLTDNTDFTVIGVIGPPGVGKSTILNELYGFDGTSPGMLPPFTIESEETRASARHCTVGIEPRISNERIILLDSQPVFSPSVLAEMIRPDGSSTISILGGESLSAELAHELMGIQLGVFLTSICHIVVVVSDGLHDLNMWNLMSTVDLLKHGIPDPSSLSLSYPQSSNLGSSDKENKDKIQEGGEEYVATPVFVHAKLHDQDLAPHNLAHLKKGLTRYFVSSSFVRSKNRCAVKHHNKNSGNPSSQICDSDSELNLFFLPYERKDGSTKAQYNSYATMLWKIRDQILSMDTPSFSRTLSERDWLKNSAKVWDLVKNSPIIAEYSRTLQSSGMFRR